MENKMANEIEKAWLAAGMQIYGYVIYAEMGGMTYQVSFGYKADGQKSEAREKMLKIAQDAGCYLFLDFSESGTWREGRVKFITQSNLMLWGLLLEKKLDKLRLTYGYIQEQESSFAVAELLLTAITYLHASLGAANNKTVFSSNELELQKHIEAVSKIHQSEDYIREVNLNSKTMYRVLADIWWQR